MTDGVDNQNVEPPSPPTPPPPPPKPEPIEPEALHEQVTGVAPQTRSVDSSTEPAATESMQFEQPLEVEGETYPPGSTATAHEALPAVVVASSDSDQPSSDLHFTEEPQLLTAYQDTLET